MHRRHFGRGVLAIHHRIVAVTWRCTQINYFSVGKFHGRKFHARKFCRRKSCDFVRKQAFCSYKFCDLCFYILRVHILRLSFYTGSDPTDRGVFAKASSSGATFTAESCVRGYHIYKISGTRQLEKRFDLAAALLASSSAILSCSSSSTS